MLNRTNDEKSNSYGQKPDQNASSRVIWSPELRRICLINEEGELASSTEQPGNIIIDDEGIFF